MLVNVICTSQSIFLSASFLVIHFVITFFFAEVEGWIEIDFKLHICAFVYKVMLLNFMSNSPCLKGSKSYK